MAKAKLSEDAIQIAVMQHIRARGVPGLVAWHTPNGGKRHPRTARRLKEMGTLAGVSDIIAVYRHNIYALELKAEKGRPTAEQLAFQSAMEAQGAFTCICYGIDRAVSVLKAWGLIK